MPFSAFDPALAEPALTVTFGAPLTAEGWTLTQLVDELLLTLGGRQDIDEERLVAWINASYIDLATSLTLAELRASYTFTTVTAKSMYMLPKQLRASLRVSVVDAYNYPVDGGYAIPKKDEDWYRAQNTLQGFPQGYFTVNASGGRRILVLYPTPEPVQTITVDGTIRPDPLAADSDSPILPTEWHEAILLGARAKAHSSLLEWDAALIMQNELVNFVRRRSNLLEDEDSGRMPLSSVPRSSAMFQRPVRNLMDRPTRLDLDAG